MPGLRDKRRAPAYNFSRHVFFFSPQTGGVKRLLILGVLVLVMAAGWRSYGSPETGTGTLTLSQPAPNVGEAAPEFAATSVTGETFRLDDRGTYVLAFWSTLNQGSYRSRLELSEMAREYSDADISFAAVYVNNPSGDYSEAPYTVIMDPNGRLTSLYNVKRVPRLFLIENGRVEFVYNSYHEENRRLLEDRIAQLLPEEGPGQDREPG